MTRPTITPRPISPQELAVILRTLDVCAAVPISDSLRASVAELEVVSRCECGCDTVNFKGWGKSSPLQVIADGIADTPDGKGIGVIVFGSPDRVSCLEVYSYDDEPARLPKIESIRAYNSAT